MHPVRITLPQLFPDSVAVHAISFNDELASADIWLPSTIQAAAPKRRAEFVAGRVCAREALFSVGMQYDQAIPIGAMRAPIWPRGYVGSITHTIGLAAAAVARTHHARSLGIDVERLIDPETVRNIAQTVASSGELRLAARAGLNAPAAFVTLFAAKEALFKCLAPLVGRYFDFLDVKVTSMASHKLSLQLLVELTDEFRAGRSFEARFALFGDRVMIAIFMPSAA